MLGWRSKWPATISGRQTPLARALRFWHAHGDSTLTKSKKPTHLRKADYFVETVPLSIVQELVRLHHYSKGGSNTATYRHGLMNCNRPDTCVGAAWWIPPTRTAAEASFSGDWRKVLTLTRLVVAPGEPTNSASFLLSQSVKRIARDGVYKCLVTYADTWQNHTGTIYKACGWEYVGLTKPEAIYVDAAGRVGARKRGPRTLTRAEMEAAGYRLIGRYPKHKFRKVLP